MLDRFFGRRGRPGPADPLRPRRPADAAGEPLMPSPPAGRAAGDFVAPLPPRRLRPGDLMPSPAGGLSLPEVPAGVWHDNRRLAEHLRTTGDDGLVPTLIADVLATGGAAGFANSRDLIHQVAAHDPARAASLLDKAAAKLPADKRPLADALGAGRTPDLKLLQAAATDDGKRRPAAGTKTPAVPAAPSQRGAPSPTLEPVVPAYRKAVFARDPQAWPDWLKAVDGLPGVSPSEKRAYSEIFAAEGGGRPDPASGAASGILQGTLDDLITRGKVHGIAPGTKPKDLPLGKRVDVYRGYFDDVLHTVGGHGALGKLDLLTASALGDTMMRHGRRKGAALLQQAINQVSPGAVGVDGAMGPKTFGALRRLSADPEDRRKFLDALANQRTKAVAGEPTAKGDRVRFDHFRFGNSR